MLDSQPSHRVTVGINQMMRVSTSEEELRQFAGPEGDVVPDAKFGNLTAVASQIVDSVLRACGTSIAVASGAYLCTDPGTVSGRIVEDLDRSMNVSEGDIPADQDLELSVVLRSSTGAVLATTNTNSSGRYSFSGVRAGIYEVTLSINNQTDTEEVIAFAPTRFIQSPGQQTVRKDFGLIETIPEVHLLQVFFREDCELNDSCPEDTTPITEFELFISGNGNASVFQIMDGTFSRTDLTEEEFRVAAISQLGIRILDPVLQSYTSSLGSSTNLTFVYTRLVDDMGSAPCELDVLFIIDGSESITWVISLAFTLLT